MGVSFVNWIVDASIFAASLTMGCRDYQPAPCLLWGGLVFVVDMPACRGPSGLSSVFWGWGWWVVVGGCCCFC